MPQIREEFFEHPHNKTIAKAIREMEMALGNLKRIAFDLDDAYREGADYFIRLEENLFNEDVLYEALGKEDARTVLGVYEDYKRLMLLLLDLIEED